MSVTVELADLQERLSEYGPIAFLITVGEAGHLVVRNVEVFQPGSWGVEGNGATLDISSYAGAELAMKQVDAALKEVNDGRADLGGRRLEPRLPDPLLAQDPYNA